MIVSTLSTETTSQEAAPLFKAEVTEVLNGIHTLVLETSADTDLTSDIKEEYSVIFRDEQGYKEYLIKEVVDNDSNYLPIKTVSCQFSPVELKDDLLFSNYAFTNARQLLQSMLNGTRWQVGTVESGISNRNFNEETENQSVWTGVNAVAKVFECDLYFHIAVSEKKVVQRYVSLYKQIGSNSGKRFEIDKDITEIKRTVDTTEIKTAIYPVGKETEDDTGHKSRIDISSVEWKKSAGDPADKPKGQMFISDNASRIQWGRKNSDGTIRDRFIFMEMDFDSPEALASMAWVQLGRYSKPKVTYEAKVIDLYRLTADQELKHEQVFIGDTVSVIDRNFSNPIEISERVIELRKDLLLPENTSVVIGSAKGSYSSDINRVDVLESKVDEVNSSIISVITSANGKNKTYHQSTEPNHSILAIGDSWVRPHPDNPTETQWLVWNGTNWDIILDTSETSEIKAEIEELEEISKDAQEKADQAIEDVGFSKIEVGKIKEEVTEISEITIATSEKSDKALAEAEASRQTANEASQKAFNSEQLANSAKQDALSALALGDGNRTQIESIEGQQKVINTAVEGNTVKINSLQSDADSLSLSLGKVQSDVENIGTRNILYDLEGYSKNQSDIRTEDSGLNWKMTLNHLNNNTETRLTIKQRGYQAILDSDLFMTGYLFVNGEPAPKDYFSSTRINTSCTSSNWKINTDGSFVFHINYYKVESSWFINTTINPKYISSEGTSELIFKEFMCVISSKPSSFNYAPELIMGKSEFAIFEANYKGFQQTVSSDITGLQSQQTQTDSQLSSTVEKVENLNVGIRNFALLSGELKKSDSIVRYELNLQELRKVKYQKITVSFEAKSHGEFHIVDAYLGSGNSAVSKRMPKTEITPEFKQYYFTFELGDEVDEFKDLSVRVRGSKLLDPSNEGKEFSVYNVNVKKGDILSDWSPAPEDNASKTEVTQLSNQIALTAQEVKTLDTTVTKQQGQIVVLTDQVSQTVSDLQNVNGVVVEQQGQLNIMSDSISQTVKDLEKKKDDKQFRTRATSTVGHWTKIAATTATSEGQINEFVADIIVDGTDGQFVQLLVKHTQNTNLSSSPTDVKLELYSESSKLPSSDIKAINTIKDGSKVVIEYWVRLDKNYLLINPYTESGEGIEYFNESSLYLNYPNGRVYACKDSGNLQRLKGAESSIVQLSNSITQTIQNVTEIEGALTTQQTQIKQLDDSITQTVIKIETVDDKVVKQQTQIIQLDSRITQVVREQTELNSKYSKIEQTTDAIRSEVVEIGQAVSDIGTYVNYLVNADNFSNSLPYTLGMASVYKSGVDESEMVKGVFKVVQRYNNNGRYHIVDDKSYLERGVEYTLSGNFEKYNLDINVELVLNNSATPSKTLVLNSSKDWEFTFTVPKTGNYDVRFYTMGSSRNYSYLSKMKLNKGNKRIAQTVDTASLSFRISTVEQTSNGLKTEVAVIKNEQVIQSSQITQLSDNINLRVEKDKVISQINISPETIRIQSKFIHLSGTSLIDYAVIKTAHIADLAVTGAKIQDASISNAKIINLDVDKISGNTTNFVQSNWNGLNSQVQITSEGLVAYDLKRNENTKLSSKGIEFFGDGKKTGQLSSSVIGGNGYTGIAVNNSSVFYLGYNLGTSGSSRRVLEINSPENILTVGGYSGVNVAGAMKVKLKEVISIESPGGYNDTDILDIYGYKGISAKTNNDIKLTALNNIYLTFGGSSTNRIVIEGNKNNGYLIFEDNVDGFFISFLDSSNITKSRLKFKRTGDIEAIRGSGVSGKTLN